MFKLRERSNGGFRVSIRVTVVGMFLLITMLTAAVAIGLQYYFGTKLATETSLERYRDTANNTSEYLTVLDKRAVEATRMLASYPDIIKDGHVSPFTRKLFAETLRNNPLFYAIYIGQENGDFYELVNLNASSEVRNQLKAMPHDRWLVIRISGKGREREKIYHYYDKEFNERISHRSFSEYQASKRPWFINARNGAVHKTDPYLFQHLQEPGQTYSTRIKGQGAVLAVDIALSSLSGKLAAYSINSDSRIYLYKSSGELIASSESESRPVDLPPSKPLKLTAEQQRVVKNNPVLRVSNELDWPPFDFMVSGEPYGYSIDVLSLVEEMTGLQFRYVNGHSWPVLKKMFTQGELDIIHPVLGTKESALLGDMSEALTNISFGVLTKKGAPRLTDISQINGKRVAIPRGWSIIATMREHFPNIRIIEVDGVKGMFDAVRHGRADAGIDIAAFLKYTTREFFLDDVEVQAPIKFGNVGVPKGLHYIVNPSRKGVVELINRAIANISEDQRKALDARWFFTNGSEHRQMSTVPYQALIAAAGDRNKTNRLWRETLSGERSFVYIKAIGQNESSQDYFAVVTPVASVLAPVVAKVKTAVLITAASFLVLLPVAMWLASLIVNPVKQLALENEKIRKREYRGLRSVDSHIVEIDELNESLMAMAHSIEKHTKEQEALMDSFIELIAQAIDDKSPYTAGHCERVPQLAMMLAEKAESSNEPPFDRFHFDGEQEWREFRIGAWLHDCGKITTPEHVVDKGTKLEAIYDRIHEVRMRFEVLWRDAEIEYLSGRVQQPDQEPELRRRMEQKRAWLEEAFTFVASCNVGGEFMDEEDQARLDELAKVTWWRHFDNKLGLSHVERARFTTHDEALPVAEPLLDDKPWHIIERINSTEYDKRLGIRMDVPEHLYNRGELYNLKIARGTLTPEDRFKINEHMISTIRMLDKLPLPKELERVPRYASTHHETLDGRGYPRKLTAKALSIPERIMVLADIFEALTAADRPYKVAKPVSVALDILSKMVEEQHVDRDVFRLFLTSGVYRDYARRFLTEKQLDEIDISSYLEG